MNSSVCIYFKDRIILFQDDNNKDNNNNNNQYTEGQKNVFQKATL
jgi:hypothetical protein